jgi:dienelactone hydrolase
MDDVHSCAISTTRPRCRAAGRSCLGALGRAGCAAGPVASWVLCLSVLWAGALSPAQAAQGDAGPLPVATPASPAPARAVPTTIRLSLDGRSVVMDVYRPLGPPAAARGAVILSHGFTRSRRTLGHHAEALAAAGVLAITPDLPFTFDFQRNAQALAALVGLLREGGSAGGVFGAPLERVVLVGFSAGGLSSLLAAATPGVVGYVGLDPFDRERGAVALGRDFAPGLATEVILLRAPPSRCNAQAVAAPWGAALPALVSDRVVEGASHCDFEAPSDWMCRLACGAPDPARQAQVRDTLLAAVARWLPRPADDPAPVR